MAQRKTIPFLGGSNKDRAISANNQLTSNLITARKGQGAKSPVILESAPGRIQLNTAANGGCRSGKMIRFAGKLYGVFGDKLVSIDAAYTVVEVGTLNTVVGPVILAAGRNYIMVVDGGDGYTWNDTTFADITDLDFPGVAAGSAPTHCVYIDGAFIVADPSTDNFFRSDSENPTSWNALNFEAASVAPDGIKGIAATASILYMIGETTTQPYYNDSNTDFPYAVYLSGVVSVGAFARYSIAESDEGVFFLATTPEGGLFAYRMQGTQGSIISGDEQDGQFADLIDAAGGVGFIYKQAGKAFYVIQFSTDNITLVYNITAEVWETRETNSTQWDVGGHGLIGKKNIVGGLVDNNFYELSLKHYSDGDFELVRKRRTQVIHSENYRIDFYALIIDFEPGVGLVTGQGSDPICSMRYSNDGGQSWSSVLQASIGAEGEHGHRARFSQLGAGRNRVFEFWVSDPVQVAVKGAYAELAVLRD